jgi:hypothetical protein
MGIQIAPWGNHQFVTNGGAPAAGYQLFVYDGRSTEKVTVYTDVDGVGEHTNPIIIDTNGFTPYPIYIDSTRAYKFVLAFGEDSDPPTMPLYVVDQVTVGTDEVGTTLAEWTLGTTPTYVGATQFSIAGDQRVLYQLGRRVKLTLASGPLFGMISAHSFASVTTVTVILDSGVLDNTLSSVSYSFLSADGSAWPGGRTSGTSTVFLGPVSFPLLSPFNLLPAGMVFPFAGNTKPPAGYLVCNGQAVSRTGFPALFSSISTTFGVGDGVNTFNVPSITAINANILYCIRYA